MQIFISIKNTLMKVQRLLDGSNMNFSSYASALPFNMTKNRKIS